jgi:hypothetical protein
MVPRPMSFVSVRRLQEQRPQARKVVLGLSPDEDDFCSSKAKHRSRTAPGPDLFVLVRRLQQQRPQL